MNSRFPRKKTSFIAVTAVAIALVSLLAAEIVLRIYNAHFPSPFFYSGSYNQNRGKPHADDWDFKLNSGGFKDQEFTEKEDGVFRILGIGDSFTFGVVPYRHNYLTLLESRFEAENANVEVLNMGIPSTEPEDYQALLVKEGLALEPDMVLLSFFTGNDFKEKRKKEPYEYSYVASLVHGLLKVQRGFEGVVIHGKGEYCDTCPTFKEKQFLEIEYRRSDIYLKENPDFPERLQNTTYHLEQIRNTCERKGIDLVVVVIPDEIQVNPELREKVWAKFYPDLEGEAWDIRYPNRRLAEELEKLGIESIDLLDPFSNAPGPLYRLRDTHWNIPGNELAAEILYEFLRERLITREVASR